MIKLITIFICFFTLAAYPQRVSELPAASDAGPGNLFLLVQAGVTKKITYENLVNSLAQDTNLIVQLIYISGDTNWTADGDDITNTNAGKVRASTPFVAEDTATFQGRMMIEDTMYLKRDAIPKIGEFEPIASVFAPRKLPGGVRQMATLSILNLYRRQQDSLKTLSEAGTPDPYAIWLKNTVTGDIYLADTANRVGIGTTTPSEALDVNGNVSIKGTLSVTLDSASTPYGVYYDPTTKLLTYDSAASGGESSVAPPDLLIRNPFIETDSTANGVASLQIAGESLSFGNICYVSSNGKLYKADADSNVYIPAIYMCLEKGGLSADSTGIFLEEGYVRCDTWNWTIGAQSGVLYTSTNSGAMTPTAPFGSNDIVQVVGVAITSNVVKFRTEITIIELY